MERKPCLRDSVSFCKLLKSEGANDENETAVDFNDDSTVSSLTTVSIDPSTSCVSTSAVSYRRPFLDPLTPIISNHLRLPEKKGRSVGQRRSYHTRAIDDESPATQPRCQYRDSRCTTNKESLVKEYKRSYPLDLSIPETRRLHGLHLGRQSPEPHRGASNATIKQSDATADLLGNRKRYSPAGDDLSRMKSLASNSSNCTETPWKHDSPVEFQAGSLAQHGPPKCTSVVPAESPPPKRRRIELELVVERLRTCTARCNCFATTSIPELQRSHTGALV